MLNSLLVLCSCLFLVEPFFLFSEKSEPHLIYCLKVCPKYCSPQRRSDHDSSSFTSPIIYEEEDFHYPFLEELPGYDRYHIPQCKHTSPKPTTKPTPTSPKPTTEEPTWICEVCIKKCNYPASQSA